ncbi:hypothetical protein M231_05987 [Tremella mesenterica]|uniref:Uncharacterized protein n=1 Tax=Tremella mesenterica TaxID=5217 RepID=A0A4Q1BGQ7_TREME|nr:hypothetical protein M231_05987 [Tremella mesenterica]
MMNSSHSHGPSAWENDINQIRGRTIRHESSVTFDEDTFGTFGRKRVNNGLRTRLSMSSLPKFHSEPTNIRRRLSLSPILTSLTPRSLLGRRRSTPPVPQLETAPPVLTKITANAQPASHPVPTGMSTQSPIPHSTDTEIKDDTLNVDSNDRDDQSISSTDTSEVDTITDDACSPLPSLTATPNSSFIRRIDRSSSTPCELSILRETEEQSFQPLLSSSSVHSTCSPNSPDGGIWLCSRPSPLAQKEKGPSSCKKNLPMVVRSYSTARLAQAFDDQGRVICLSTHSDKVVHFSNVWDPCSAKKPDLTRIMSEQNLDRKQTGVRVVPKRAMTTSVLGSTGAAQKDTMENEEKGEKKEGEKGYMMIPIVRRPGLERRQSDGVTETMNPFGSWKKRSVKAWNEYVKV